MSMSDRAFRALAQAEPQVVLETLRLVAPRLVGRSDVVTVADVASTRQDALASPVDADLALLLGDDRLLHTECQGYRDATFQRRLLRYHLWFVLQHFGRRVDTVALWLTRPPLRDTARVIRHGAVSVEVLPIVLAQEPAEMFLDSDATACFAAGANRGARSDRALCQQVARRLAICPSWHRRHIWDSA